MMQAKTNWQKTTFLLKDANATFLFGKQIGMNSIGGEMIGLIGPLGAGKTVFVQGLASGLSVTDNAVTSPTFVIVNLYQGRLPLCHADLYRLDQPIGTIGLEEYLDWNGVTAIEWADKEVIPELNLMIEFCDSGLNERTATLNADPNLFDRLHLSALKREWP
jgi:tRNA threonylcarbamoyladenosine biosynthesis protein TsaE